MPTGRLKGVKAEDTLEFKLLLPKRKGVKWQEELRYLKEVLDDHFDQYCVSRKVVKRDERALL